MCPERLVHNRERAGGKRVLARQACQRPGARLPAALRGAARWTLAGWSSRSVVSSCGCAAPHSLPDSSCARGSPHRTDPAANTSRRRSARCSYSSTDSASARWSTVPADTSGAAKTSRRYDPVISDPATSSQLLYVPRMLLPAGLGVLRLLRAACTCLYVDRPCESAGVRTYGVQRIRHEHHRASFVQVRCHVELQAGAYCKTVGSAYVGSNPTPATTCENGPRAAETRPGGSFSPCHGMYQRVSRWVDARQWLRTYSGQRPAETSGAYNRSLSPPRGAVRQCRRPRRASSPE